MKDTAASTSALVAASERSTQRQHHRPYRLEVHGITPISISLLCSLRPLPLSAIPRSARNAKLAAKGTADPQSAGKASVQASSARNQAFPLANAVTATRSPNRKVTKVSGKGTASLLNRSKAAGKAAAQSSTLRRDSSDWPSDDGATAVEDNDEEDEDDDEAALTHNAAVNGVETGRDDGGDRSGYSAALMPSVAALASGVRALESGLAVCVNGVPWGQVVVGDNGSAEASVIIHGLQPAREYDIQLTVDGKQSGSVSVRTTASTADDTSPSRASHSQGASASTAVEAEDNVPTSPAHVSVARLARPHTPPMQDTENDLVGNESMDVSLSEVGGASAGIGASNTLSTGEQAVTAAEIQAAIRKARKDASRAESALRNEIEAIKRGLDRMSDVDHRSKQKVLALQESIRQATTQARDIDEEATAVESEREVWEEREREKEEELKEVRTEVEEKIRSHQQRIKSDREEVEAMEKKLEQVTKSIEEKTSAKEKIEKEKIAEMEQRLSQMHSEIESALARPTAAQGSMYYQGIPFQPSFANNRGGRHAIRGGAPTAPRGRGGHHFVTAQNQGGRGGYQNRNQGRFYSAGAQFPAGTEAEEYAQIYGHGPQYQDGLAPAHTSNFTHQPSMLNPQKPEFIPSGVSGAHAATNSPLNMHVAHLPSQHQQQEHSPIAMGTRFPFSSHLHDMDAGRRNSSTHMDVSPLASTSHAPTMDSSAATTASWAAPGSMSPWATSNAALAGSPQMGHDIWRSPVLPTVLPTGSSPQNQLRTKTSMPFALRANADPMNRNPAFLYPNDVNGAGVKQGSSAPVSPSQPQEEANRSTFAL